MLFTDPEFLFLFLPLVLVGSLLLPRLLRNTFLTIASLWFYAAGEGIYVIIMLATTAIDYLVALSIQRADVPWQRKVLLSVSIAGNLLILIYFKYFVFLIANLSELSTWIGLGPIRVPTIQLPVGISFFTFQAMSYVIDVYRRDIPAMRNPLHYMLYISLFPQLIAGPIVRAKTIMAEIFERTVQIQDFACGVRRFVTGLAKKLVIADTMGVAADWAFNATPAHLTTGLAWVGLICYALQIYYDFSGYSDMAIGMGRMLGFRFLENFRYPYFAQSVTEFWRRWHISLSTWFRDYLYIPLGGNRVPKWRLYVNLLIVFALCGIWHGAAWTFVIWGLWHGAFLVAERAGLGKWISGKNRIARHVYILAVVLCGWVFFRAVNLHDAMNYFAALAGFGAEQMQVNVRLGLDIWVVMMIGIIFSAPVAKWIKMWWVRSLRTPSPYAKGVYLMGRLTGVFVTLVNLVVSMLLCASGTHNPFIYFRF